MYSDVFIYLFRYYVKTLTIKLTMLLETFGGTKSYKISYKET